MSPPPHAPPSSAFPNPRLGCLPLFSFLFFSSPRWHAGGTLSFSLLHERCNRPRIVVPLFSCRVSVFAVVYFAFCTFSIHGEIFFHPSLPSFLKDTWASPPPICMEYFVCMYVCAPRVCSVQGGHKRTLNPLELQLQTLRAIKWVLGLQLWSSVRVVTFSTAEPPFQLLV